MSAQDSADNITVRIDKDFEDLIPNYLENRRKDIELILDALGEEDYKTIDILGHSMKGTGEAYGFAFISELGRKIELSAQDKSGALTRKAAAELAGYLDRIKIVYE